MREKWNHEEIVGQMAQRRDQETSTFHEPLIPSVCSSNHSNHQIRSPIPTFRSPWCPIRSRTEDMGVSKLENIRCSTIVLAISNALVALLGAFLLIVVYPACERQYVLPFLAVSMASCIKIVTMVQCGIAQEATARTILESPGDTAAVVNTIMRHERRLRYKRWLWWTRFALVITVLQFVGAFYFIFHMASYIAHDETSSGCALGKGWRQMIDGGDESYWFYLQSWCALLHWFNVLLVWMF